MQTELWLRWSQMLQSWISCNNARSFLLWYSEITLLRPPKIKTSCLLYKPYLQILIYFFLHFPHSVYLWLETTFGTVQKWSWRPLLDSPKGGLNIGILLYIYFPPGSKWTGGPENVRVDDWWTTNRGSAGPHTLTWTDYCRTNSPILWCIAGKLLFKDIILS